MNQRISNLRNKMKTQNLKAVLINNLKNVYYLTNFWGSNGTALVTEERVVLFTDSRYTIHAHATCFPFVEIVETRDAVSYTHLRERYQGAQHEGRCNHQEDDKGRY